MPNFSAIDSISPAFKHTQGMMFAPFRFGLWARLGLLGILTGGMSGGFNFPTSIPSSFPSPPRQHSKEFVSLAAALSPHLFSIVFFIAVLVACAAVFLLLLMFVSSVCRFILFESVLTRRCALREGWRRWQTQGWRFLGWQLLFSVAMLAVLALIVVPPLLYALSTHLWANRSEHMLQIVLGITAIVMLVVALMVVAAVISVFTRDFVVPQMALEGLGVMESWRRLLRMVGSEKPRFAGYVGMKIVLSIAGSILAGIVGVIVILILLIPILLLVVLLAIILALLVGKPAVLAGSALAIALLIVFGVIAAAALLFALAFVTSPVTVFFSAYPMYFFADRYPPLRVRLYPMPPIITTPPGGPLPPPEPLPAI